MFILIMSHKPIEKPLNREQIYRVCIHSKDAISGTFFDGVHQVDLPDFIKSEEIGKYHIAVEEFLLNNSSTQLGVTRTLVVEADISQPDTYSTNTQGNTQVLFTMSRAIGGTALSYYNSITNDTFGIPLVDVSFLRSKQMRVRLKRADGVLYDNTTNGMGSSSWEMTLAIYPFEP